MKMYYRKKIERENNQCRPKRGRLINKKIRYHFFFKRFYHISYISYNKDYINVGKTMYEISKTLTNKVIPLFNELFISQEKIKANINKNNDVCVYPSKQTIQHKTICTGYDSKEYINAVIQKTFDQTITNSQVSCIFHPEDDELVLPNIPINKETENWMIPHLEFIKRTLYVEKKTLYKELNKDVIYLINERQIIFENKLNIYKEYKLFYSYDKTNFGYYLVPQKDIYMQNGIIIKVDFKNAIQASKKIITEHAYNIINDSKIMNIYNPSMEQRYIEQIINKYNEIKD